MYIGSREIVAPQEVVAKLYETKKIEANFDQRYRFYENEYIIIKTKENQTENTLTVHRDGYLILLNKHEKHNIQGQSPKNDEQVLALDALLNPDIQVVTLTGKAGSGKAQPLDAKVLTPNGWTAMGEIQPGSTVITPLGKHSKVKHTFPQGEKDIYKVTFSDNTSTECCIEHLWYTKTKKNRKSLSNGTVKSLKDVKDSLFDGDDYNHSIPLVRKLNFADVQLPIDPYLLGYIIGREDKIRISKLDILREKCAELKILGLSSSEKFIPDIYKLGSYNQRFSLLQGLMDSIGYPSKEKNHAYLETESTQLRDDFTTLAQSLGMLAVTTKDSTPYHVDIHSYHYINPFRLSVKLKDYRSDERCSPVKYIVSVEYVGKKEAKCIYIEDLDHLYITDDYVVTHNTFLLLIAALESVQRGDYKSILLTKPMTQVGKNAIAALPGPQPLNSKILTPSGWTTMGEIQPGDYVISEEGKPVLVTKIHEHGKKDVYQITTTDGKKTKCCDSHLWLTQSKKESRRSENRWSIKTTKEIRESLTYKGKENKKNLNHRLPYNKPIQFMSPTVLPIPAYTLGCLLGDGTMGNSISISNSEKEIINSITSELKTLNCDLHNVKNTLSHTINGSGFNNKPARLVKLTNTKTNSHTIYPSIGKAIEKTGLGRGTLNRLCEKQIIKDEIKYEFLPQTVKWTNFIKNRLENLGLIGTRYDTKFIPEIYKKASIHDRVQLIRGLMDTDGTIKKSGEASFTTVSKQLALDVIEVVRSLGGKARLRSRNRIGETTKIKDRIATTRYISYEFNISLPKYNLFNVSRKAKRYNTDRKIHHCSILDVTYAGKELVKCITVDSKTGLYITDDFIVTHNSVEDKYSPYLINYMCNISHILGGKTRPTEELFYHFIRQYNIQFQPIQLMRGASWNDTLIAVDECQSLSAHEMVTVGTRVGQGSKLVLLGDLNQRDVNIAKEKTGMFKFLNHELSKNSKLSASLDLKECVRGPVSKLFGDIFET